MQEYEIKINEKNAFKIGKELCEKYHYSATCPPSKYYFTIYENSELVGILTYGTGANMNGSKQFNLSQQEALELTRVCFSKHQNFLSLYISKAHKHLKSKGIKLIYSYSDLRQSHFGTLYKSANFKFVAERKLNGDEIFNEEKNRWEHQRNYWKKYKLYKQQNSDITWNEWIKKENFKTRKQSNKYLWVIDWREK